MSTPSSPLLRHAASLPTTLQHVALLGQPYFEPVLDRIDAIVNVSGFTPAHAEATRRAATRYLIRRWGTYLEKVWLYELNMARQEQTGRDEAEIYRDFVTGCVDPAFVRERMEKFGGLIARLERMSDAFADFLQMYARHWRESHKEVRCRLGIAADADVESVEFGLGDAHHGAKAPIKMVIGGTTVFYKPRSLETDVCYNAVLELMAPNAGRVPTVMSDGAGWQGSVGNGTPTDAAGARRFFHQVGMHLAVSQLLAATDLHFENIRSDVDGTVYLIDTEALFHSANPAMDFGDDDMTGAEVAARRAMRTSIFATGLLANHRQKAGQFSGLVEAGEVQPVIKPYVVVNAGRADMRLEQRDGLVETNSVLPLVDGQRVRISDYRDALEQGYLDVMGRVREHEPALLSVIDQTCPSGTRQILRSTYIYTLLMTESSHPLIASDESELVKLFAKLERGPAGVRYLEAAREAEVAQMMNFDVPAFFADPRTRTVDGVDAGDLFPVSALALSKQIIRHMAETGGHDGVRMMRDVLVRPREPMSSWIARGTGSVEWTARLAETACWAADRASALWFGRTGLNHPLHEMHLAPMTGDYYSGHAGLLRCATTLHQIEPTAETERLLRAIQHQVSHVITRDTDKPPGLYSGRTGQLLARAQAAVALDDAEAVFDAHQDLLALAEHADIAEHDLIDGKAGVILGLLVMWDRTHDPKLLDRAVAIGDALVAASIEAGPRRTWKLASLDKVILGFGHGGCGIAHALHQLAIAANAPRFDDAARSAIRGEDLHYNATLGNWPDLREAEPTYVGSWCNGAVGFVMGRLAVYDLLDDTEKVRTRTALERLRARRTYPDDSLCHGTLGAVELFLLAEQVIGTGIEDAQALLGALRERSTFVSGWVDDPQNLSLMVGMGGAIDVAARLSAKDASAITSPLLIRHQRIR